MLAAGALLLAVACALLKPTRAERAEPELLQVFGPWTGVSGLAIAPDGSHVAALSLQTVRVWDVKERGEQLHQPWKGSNLPGFNPLAFSPDGARLVVGPNVYDWSGNHLRVTLDPNTEPKHEYFQPDGVAVSPDGKLLATTGGTLYHYQLKLWDLESGKWLRTLVTWESATCFLHSAAFSPNGAQLAADVDGAVQVWDVRSGELLRTLPGPGGLTLDQVVYSPDGKTLVGAGYEVDAQRNATRRVLRFWDANTGSVRHTVELGPYATTRGQVSLAYSPDGKLLAVSNGRARFFRTDTGATAGILPEHVVATRVAFFPNAPLRLAVGQSDGQVSVWKVPAD
jgi:WD40 repeat protein